MSDTPQDRDVLDQLIDNMSKTAVIKQAEEEEEEEEDMELELRLAQGKAVQAEKLLQDQLNVGSSTQCE